ncbi:DNRLRE domain-containing protein [Streptomyces sp. NPDC003023]|uniref:DNRLRE domain-containing protein n=1 Tax=Streptomyces sp. NPDC003023 TaxID=3364675 RepID=UPI0036C92F7E
MGEDDPTPSSSPGNALGLPGLAGPQPGSHDEVLGASLQTGILALTVDRKGLDDPDTVYPLFIDPSFRGRKLNWTLLYSKYPSSSFHNGQNFNDGTNEARVGYESTSGGLSRSVFNFEIGSGIHGAKIHSAYFRALQTYSWGCSSRQYNLHLTSPVSSSNTWNNQPTWGETATSATNGYGYKSVTCPDRWIGLNIQSVAQRAATSSWTILALGLRAANESDTNAWKKFQANGESAPYVEIVYNHPPDEPRRDAMKIEPGGVCDVEEPYMTVGKSDLRFSGTGRDRDGDLQSLHFKIWATDNTKVVLDKTLDVNSNGAASTLIPRQPCPDRPCHRLAPGRRHNRSPGPDA